MENLSGRRRRRSPSLRTRLLFGLITLTAVLFVVMGVVTAVVLGTLEGNQLNAEVRLASQQSLPLLAGGAGGFSAVYLSLDDGATGRLTTAPPGTSFRRRSPHRSAACCRPGPRCSSSAARPAR